MYQNKMSIVISVADGDTITVLKGKTQVKIFGARRALSPCPAGSGC